jgi:polysaccharide export outer membrane protein
MRCCGRTVISFALAVTTLISTGCAAQTTSSPVAASPASASVNAAYRLGLGDKLRIQVFGEAELSGEFQVSGTGALSMPLIGDVPAVGLTARELEARLVERYRAGYLRDPKIAVEVYDFRPYFILGEVEKPGRYPSLEGVTVLNAIATAGGFTYRANKKRIYIRSAGEATERLVDLSNDVLIRPGDVLRVGERHF